MDDFVRRDATHDEILSLRHVPDSLPPKVWVVILAGAVERFTYYSITTPWQNFMQNRPGHKDVPGALGIGQSRATTISNAYLFFSCLTPLPIAILSDTRLGRYNTQLLSLALYTCGTLVMFVTSLPDFLDRGAGAGGLAASMILIGLAVGGNKATFSPFLGDQYERKRPQLARLKNGTLVVVDHAATLQYIYNLFYLFTNLAHLLAMASTVLEFQQGFGAAFFIPACSSWVALGIFVYWSRSLSEKIRIKNRIRNALADSCPPVKHAPEGNVLPKVGKILACAARNRCKLDATIPSYQMEHFGYDVSWDERTVVEVKRALGTCRLIFCFVIFYLCYNQINNNLISQAGQMRLHGIPNDAVQAFNGLACVIVAPVIEKVIYPLLHNLRIPFGHIMRISTAFLFVGVGMAYAAGVQKLIYSSGPCYEAPLACPDSDGNTIPNNVNVWVQAPAHFILAFGEILGFVSVTEISYSEAPSSMKALVQSLMQVTSAVGAVLGMLMSPLAVDPNLILMYSILAVASVLSSVLFLLAFRGHETKGKIRLED